MNGGFGIHVGECVTRVGGCQVAVAFDENRDVRESSETMSLDLSTGEQR